jgi:predicted nucleotidyltransferase component of viral defense system
MISSETIKELALKNQTTELNIAREYLQNLFLSYFYQQDKSEAFLFKGGTALKLIYQSPRYSEDLDFSSTTAAEQDIKGIIEKTLIEVNREGEDFRITESKSTSGGYLAIIEGTVGEWGIRILLNVSLRSQEAEKEAVMVANPFMPSYLVSSLHEDQMVQEKISALLTRKKPRDFFDLYFILRKGMSRKVVASYKDKLMSEIKKIDDRAINDELKLFLPRSYWPVLREFRKNLVKELKRR